MADNEDDLVDYDEDEVRFIGSRAVRFVPSCLVVSGTPTPRSLLSVRLALRTTNLDIAFVVSMLSG